MDSDADAAEAAYLRDQECPCLDMEYANHWAEDQLGTEIRVECGCPCPKCQEY